MYGYPQNHTFEFEFRGEQKNVTLPLSASVKQTYTLAPHKYSYTGRLPRDWRTDYFAMYMDRRDDEEAIRALVSAFRQMAPRAGNDDLAEMAVAFVQGAISYDYQKLHRIDEDNIRYPYETLYDGTGVCADKSILLAKILREMGYDLTFFVFERANHMAIGLKAPAGYGHYRTDYTFVESTAYTPIGRVPETYIGGIKLERNPLVVPVKGAGRSVYEKIVANRHEEAALEKQYGKDYLNMKPGQQSLQQKMTVLKAEMDELKKKLRGCRGTVSQDKYYECMELQKQHTQKVEAYNQMVAEFNAMN
jgi:hypothetical protein